MRDFKFLPTAVNEIFARERFYTAFVVNCRRFGGRYRNQLPIDAA